MDYLRGIPVLLEEIAADSVVEVKEDEKKDEE